MNDLALVGALAGLVVAILAPRSKRRAGPMIYWAGTAVACVFVFFMAYPPNWRSGLTMSLFTAFAMTFVAYVNTPFLKIRGRIYAFSSDDRRPGQPSRNPSASSRNSDEPYGGGVSAAKSWWRAFGMVAIFMVGVVLYVARAGSPWFMAASVALIAVVALVFGYRDALLQHPIASGQHVQFVLIAIVTIGVFTALYLGAYHVTRLRLPQQGRHS